MLDERASTIAASPPSGSLPGQARIRLQEGAAELLLGQLRLHAKRVRALAAAFRRETRRLSTAVSPELERVDQGLDGIAEQITAALTAVDAAFTATFAGIGAMEHMGRTIDLEYPDRTPAERLATQAEMLVRQLRTHHLVAQAALRQVAEGLVARSNSLAIAVGRPGSQSLDQLRIVIRQMRQMSQATAEIGARLDVFVQNQSAGLQALIPAAPVKDALLASLRAREGAA
jgi:hypothetical protein